MVLQEKKGSEAEPADCSHRNVDYPVNGILLETPIRKNEVAFLDRDSVSSLYTQTR